MLPPLIDFHYDIDDTFFRFSAALPIFRLSPFAFRRRHAEFLSFSDYAIDYASIFSD